MAARSRRKPKGKAARAGRAGAWLAAVTVLAGVVWLSFLGGRGRWRPDVAIDGRPLIVIDAGHGGEDGGTQGSGVLEKAIALDTAIRLSDELRRRGLRTLLTRETDATLPLAERVRIANESRAAALVSVHFNFSTESSAVRGLEVLYSSPKNPDEARGTARATGLPAHAPTLDQSTLDLGAAVRKAACARARTPDRGTRNRPDLAVTRRTACPAVLVECAYLSNPADARRANSAVWRAELALGLAEGVVAWLAHQPIPRPH